MSTSRTAGTRTGNAEPEFELASLDVLKSEVRAHLPSALREALAAYRRFSEGTAPENAKAFTAYQQACRAALAHVQVLLNLAALAAPATMADADDSDDDLLRLIEAAKAAVSDDRDELD
jgi:hypothetical protein